MTFDPGSVQNERVIGAYPSKAGRKSRGQSKDRQRKPPCRFKQLCDPAQVWLPDAHSSISTNQSINTENTSIE